jgi:hypothetical protein
VWIGDGQWYDAVVQGLVENGYKVKRRLVNLLKGIASHRIHSWVS